MTTVSISLTSHLRAILPQNSQTVLHIETRRSTIGALARAAPFVLKLITTPSRLCKPLITTEKGSPSLSMSFYRTWRATSVENTAARTVLPRLTLVLTALLVVAETWIAVPHLLAPPLAMSKLKLRHETTPIPAYSPDASPVERRCTLVAKSHLQSRSRNGCSKLTSSPAGPPLHAPRPTRPFRVGFPCIHPPADRCSSSPR